MRPMLSLTFDDGLPCQIEHALPELNARGMKATFFVIQNSPYDSQFRSNVWAQAAKDGHEIGAHSVSHKKPAEISDAEAYSEVIDCKAFIEREAGAVVTSYAYPYTHVNETVRAAAKKTYQQARGGRVAREDKFIVPRDRVDMFNLPCFHVSEKALCEMPGWLDEAIARNAWLILMFHGIGPDETQWDNIFRESFGKMLEDIKSRPIDVLTLGAAADIYRRAA